MTDTRLNSSKLRLQKPAANTCGVGLIFKSSSQCEDLNALIGSQYHKLLLKTPHCSNWTVCVS